MGCPPAAVDRRACFCVPLAECPTVGKREGRLIFFVVSLFTSDPSPGPTPYLRTYVVSADQDRLLVA